ncbi:MAG: hypothetical protein E7474_07920 [Ruminococcaceae bacterium]|nr:hypothetical protein [Oscillospiraceae bacterium]
MTWKYLLFAQFPAFALLSVLFLVNYLRVRKSSAVKSMMWVLLFGVALACCVLFIFLGVPDFWTLKTLFPLGAASWIGIVLVLVTVIARIVHLFEKKHNQKVMEKELQKAAKEKEDAVAQAREEAAEAARQAHEEGRKAAQQEAEAARFDQAALQADAEAASSEIGSAVQTPIELMLDATPQGAFPQEPPAFDPATGLPLGGMTEPPAFDPATGLPLGGTAEPPAFDPATGLPLGGMTESFAFDPTTGQPLGGAAENPNP